MTNENLLLSDERIDSIKAGIAEAHAGKTRPAEEVLAELASDLMQGPAKHLDDE